MKSLLKKSLLAASVAVVCNVAVAGNIAVTSTQNHSKQGLAAVTTAITSSAVSYTVGAAYAVGDLITITASTGAIHKNHTWAPSLTFTASGTPGTATAGASMGVGLLSSTSDSATYRVTSVTTDVANATGTTKDGVLSLGTFSLNASAIAAGSVTLSVSTKASNGVTDVDTQGTRTGTLAKSTDQFGDLKVTTAADQVIDVAKSRKAFETGTNDTITWTASNDTSLLNAATVSKTTIVLNGKFDGLKSANFTVAGSGTVAYDDTKDQLTVTYSAPVTTDTITVTPPSASSTSAVVLNAGQFSLDGTYTYGTSSSEELGKGIAAGQWTLNGAVVNVPYMPYGSNVDQVLYVTNTGQQAGEISVSYIDGNGNAEDLGVIGTAKAKAVTKITGEVKQALMAKGLTEGKVALTITVNAPEADITVFASYNVGSDRLNVNTDQYKGKK